MKGLLVPAWILFLLLAAGCAGKRQAAAPKADAGGKYQCVFPPADLSGELGQVTRSVKKIYSISSYTTYQFRRESGVTWYHIQRGSYMKMAWGIVSTSETVSGTATVVGRGGPGVALLTCAHVVTSPDTLITNYGPDEEDAISYIRSFSVKTKQENWVKDLSACGPFAVLASDAAADLAILGKTCEGVADTAPPLPCRAGMARDLRWGNFVCIMGYPMGNLMVTTGIVSPAMKRPAGEFSVDALLNKGYSGGVILAVRKDAQAFELVGIVKTVSSAKEDILRPDPSGIQPADWMPYRGKIFPGSVDQIQYGMNTIVPAETILSFYREHREELIRAGCNLDGFFYKR